MHRLSAFVICLLVGIVPVAVAAADWPTFRGNLQRSGITAESVDATRLRSLWTFRSPHPPQTAWEGPAKWDAYAGIRGLTDMRDYDHCFPVAVAGNSVFFASSADDSVRCLDSGDGSVKWTFTTNAPVRITPTYHAVRVFFGSDDGRAYCVNASNGRLIWTYRPPVREPLIINNGRFISQWPCRTGVAVSEGTAYMAFSLLPWESSWLCALDAKTGKPTGKGRYERKLTGRTFEGGIAVTNDRLFLTRGRVEPELFDRVSGKSLGSLKNGGGSFLAIDEPSIVFHGPGNKTGWVTSSDIMSRKVRRTVKGIVGIIATPADFLLRSPLRVTAADRKTGKYRWSVSFEESFDHILAGEVVFVGGRNVIRALSLKTGRELWKTAISGDARSLAVGGGTLFVSTDQGEIHCFAPGIASGSTVVIQPVAAKKPRQRFVSPERGIEVVSHPDLIHRWVFYSGMDQRARRRGIPNAQRHVPDRKGSLPGRVLGSMRLQGVGGIEALVLDGRTASVRITDDLKKAKLPKQQITAEAWVRVDEPLKWGGIVGALQDNGKYERGWLLGFQDRRFSFAVASRGGPKRLTYLTAKTQFQKRRWYHVAGTFDGHVQRIYVNGRLEAESRMQKGEIEYPSQAFLEIGAYHDKDEYFRMTGMIHDVRLYRTALPADRLHRNFDSGRLRFPKPIELETGPYVHFLDPHRAVVNWKTREPIPTVLVLKSSQTTRRVVDPKPKRDHSATLDDLQRRRVYQYWIESGSNARTVRTPAFDLETHFNYSLPTVSGRSPFAATQRKVAAAEVKTLLKSVPTRRGICLIVGAKNAPFLYELARQSWFLVVAVDPDADIIDRARRSLIKAGVYGVRVTVRHVAKSTELPFVGNVANLIAISPRSGLTATAAQRAELLRVLRPAGGVLVLPARGGEKVEAELKSLSRNLRTPFRSTRVGRRIVIHRGKIPGAGDWSHLYGRADNSAFGGETLGGAKRIGAMRVQWIGPPGPRAQADRNGRKPSPHSTNGRLFVQGRSVKRKPPALERGLLLRRAPPPPCR